MMESNDLDLFLLFYDDLVADLQPAMTRAAYFLGVSLNQELLQCTEDNSEGMFHRKSHSDTSDPFDTVNPFPTEMKRLKTSLNKLIQQCVQGGKCDTSGSSELT